jgi:hypothetical protein
MASGDPAQRAPTTITSYMRFPYWHSSYSQDGDEINFGWLNEGLKDDRRAATLG